MTLEDLPQVMALERECFQDHWDMEAYRYEIEENSFSTMLVAVEDWGSWGLVVIIFYLKKGRLRRLRPILHIVEGVLLQR